MIPLLYSNNADIKYPLSDFHEEDIPNDILLDLSLNVPAGLEPVVGAVRVGVGFAFVSIENKADRTAIGHIITPAPAVARVYPLSMDVSGFGWVVWGPGATSGHTFYSGNVAVDLDPEAFVALEKTGLSFDLKINGFDRDLGDFMEILGGSDFLTVTREGNQIFMDRNDALLSEDDLVGLNVDQEIAEETEEQVVFTVEGTPPDENGNIDIVIVNCAADCGETRGLVVPRGDQGEGEAGELPLDIFSTREFEEGDPCAPSDQQESESAVPDPYEGCTEIERVDIIDATQGKAIGTLYTAAGALL